VKKKRIEVPPIGGEKKSLDLIPIGVKWPTIDNEKKVIRVTPQDTKNIHLSDPGVVKKFSPKGICSEIFLSHMNWPH
jgi:hypothetical protein